MTHKTKGIVLRTVKFGETSIIAAVYTELFGLQSYILKGIRKGTKKILGKANCFQPASMLEMEVYKNELKNLQFVKEYQWAHLYEKIFFDVVRNSSAMYIIELLTNCIKQPESNPALFYLVENALLQLDSGNETLVANLPLYFTLQLGSALGFGIYGQYSLQTPVLDLSEGGFVAEIPHHHNYLAGEPAKISSQINAAGINSNIENILLNRNTRRQLLEAYRQYMTFHVSDFGDMKTVAVLKEVLG